jgi:hypothetical protein
MSKLFSDLYEKQSGENEKAKHDRAKESEMEKPRKLGKQETGQEVGKEAMKEEERKEGQAKTGEVSSTPPVAEDRPTYKSSHLFTQEEFEMFEDLKLSLRREHGIRAYKNDLARAAVRLLSEDYRTNEEKSYLVDRFYGKGK